MNSSSGAYHGAELPMVSGISEYSSHYCREICKQSISFSDTEEQRKPAKTIITTWKSFAKDAENGLSKLDWTVCDPTRKVFPCPIRLSWVSLPSLQGCLGPTVVHS